MADGTPREKRSHLWEREPDNWYVEPSWVSRRLFEAESFPGRVIDPCAGMGNVIAGAAEAGVRVQGYDLRERGFADVGGGQDFFAKHQFPGRYPTDNIVSNPPYGNRPDPLPGERRRWEEEFLRVALERARCKVALYLDANWLNGSERGRWLESLPLYRVYKVGPRPPCPPGPFLIAGGKAGNGTKDYCWHVFLHGYQGAPTLHWLRRDDA